MTMLIAPEPSQAWGSLDVGGGCRGTGLVALLSLLGSLGPWWGLGPEPWSYPGS